MDKLLNKTPGAESIGVLIKEAGLDNPIHGDITTDGTTITYTPDADFNGTDTFTYYCYDGYVKTEATVTVSISQVNDNPLAVEDSGSTGEDELVSVNVLKNDTDVDTDELLNLAERHEASSLYIDDCYTNGGTHGTLEIDGANIIFDPETDFSGTQIIKYVAQGRSRRRGHRNPNHRGGLRKRCAGCRQRRSERGGRPRCLDQCACKRYGR